MSTPRADSPGRLEPGQRLRLAILLGVIALCVAALIAAGLAFRVARESFLGSSPDPDARVVIRVEDEGGTRAEVRMGELRRELAWRRFERAGQALRAPRLPAALKDRAIEDLIERQVFALEAQRLGVRASTQAVERELLRLNDELGTLELDRRLAATYQTRDDLRRALGQRATMARLMRDFARVGLSVAPEEVEVALAALPDSARLRGPRCHLAQIIVRTEEEAARVAQKLKAAPNNFAALAREHSIALEAQRGGDLGWFEAGEGPRVFDEACFGVLKPGQISPIVPSEYGFHVFRLLASAPAGPRDPARLRAEVEARLLAERFEEAEKSFRERTLQRYRARVDQALVATLEGSAWEKEERP